jgi:hypothetical protein
MMAEAVKPSTRVKPSTISSFPVLWGQSSRGKNKAEIWDWEFRSEGFVANVLAFNRILGHGFWPIVCLYCCSALVIF